MKHREHVNFIKDELASIKTSLVYPHGNCVACHLIFKLKEKLESSEQNAADLLSEVLTSDSILNREFIDLVEKIHMEDRGLGGSFLHRSRESKDLYLEAYFSNVIDELTSDLITTSHQMVLRKLLLSYLALYLAQTIGVDYHAATEELYYLLRKDDGKNSKISELIARFESKIKTTSSQKDI